MRAEADYLPLLAGIIEQVADVPAEQVEPDRELIEDLGLDSLSVVEVVFEVQKRLALEVAEEELAGVRTVHDLLGVVRAANGTPRP